MKVILAGFPDANKKADPLRGFQAAQKDHFANHLFLRSVVPSGYSAHFYAAPEEGNYQTRNSEYSEVHEGVLEAIGDRLGVNDEDHVGREGDHEREHQKDEKHD